MKDVDGSETRLLQNVSKAEIINTVERILELGEVAVQQREALLFLGD